MKTGLKDLLKILFYEEIYLKEGKGGTKMSTLLNCLSFLQNKLNSDHLKINANSGSFFFLKITTIILLQYESKKHKVH